MLIDRLSIAGTIQNVQSCNLPVTAERSRSLPDFEFSGLVGMAELDSDEGGPVPGWGAMSRERKCARVVHLGSPGKISKPRKLYWQFREVRGCMVSHCGGELTKAPIDAAAAAAEARRSRRESITWRRGAIG